jgi:hypothetical protein
LDDVTPATAFAAVVPGGRSRGGHSPAHAEEEAQVGVPPWSAVSTYRVRSLPATSTVPSPETDIVWTAALEAAEDPELGVDAVFPQAARIRPTPMTRAIVRGVRFIACFSF